MQVHVNLLNAKKISVEVKPLDTVETLKKAISQATGLPVAVQCLSQNGVQIDRRSICLGDLIKSKSLINLQLAYKQQNSISSFYVNAVTGTGRVLTVNLEEGQSSSIRTLRKQLSTMLGIPEDSLFLRLVDSSCYVNKCLGTLFNSLEECGVNRGSVVYVQIHPWEENWYHGKITRDQAEQIMSSASNGQFLIKESTHFPGDYVIFVCVKGKTRHSRVVYRRNMLFTVNDQEFFDSINEMVMFYQNNTGWLPIKLTEPVSRHQFTNGIADDSSLFTGEDNNFPRARLETNATSEIKLSVVVGLKTFSFLTNPLYQVDTLKRQIEELSGVPADYQLLRLDGKALVMKDFLLSDLHIIDNSTIHVQIHPWNEEYVFGHRIVMYSGTPI